MIIGTIDQSRLVTNKDIEKLYARATTVSEITADDARYFFDENHINGYVNSSINIGLFHNEKLSMCMSFSKPRYSKAFDYEITRMASAKNTVVVGGASKLFEYFKMMFKPKSVISYCDLRYGTGNSYVKMGFVPFKLPTIGYQYVDISSPWCRYDRMHYQKHKLGDTKGLTEHELSLGYERIWDCGHQKYIWKQ